MDEDHKDNIQVFFHSYLYLNSRSSIKANTDKATRIQGFTCIMFMWTHKVQPFSRMLVCH